MTSPHSPAKANERSARAEGSAFNHRIQMGHQLPGSQHFHKQLIHKQLIATFAFTDSTTYYLLYIRAEPSATPGAAAAASCPRAATREPHKFKMEFKMLASTKQASVAIALTLGAALGMPMSPAFSGPAPSNPAIQTPAAPSLRSGDLVRLRSGGPLMTVIGIEGDLVNCVWTDLDGHIGSERFPIAALEPGIRILGGFPRPLPDGS